MSKACASFPVTFTDFIAPMAEDEFLENYYLHQPVLLAGRDQPERRPFFGPRDLIALVGCIEANWSDNGTDYRFVRQSENLPDVFLAAKAQRPADTWVPGIFDEGWTVVANLVQRWSVPCLALCKIVESTLKTGVWTNVYYTPPSAQGLKFHSDTHDVFIRQELGSKQWRVWDRDARPEDTPLIETNLKAGEVIYIPKGFPHLAHSGEDESLHITVAFRSPWLHLRKLMIQRVKRWISEVPEELPDFLTGADVPLSAENLLRTGGLFQDWLAEDLRANGMESFAHEPPGRAADDVLDDLDQLTSSASLEFVGQPRLNTLRDRFNAAVKTIDRNKPLKVDELPLEKSEALNLARLLIGSGEAVLT